MVANVDKANFLLIQITWWVYCGKLPTESVRR